MAQLKDYDSFISFYTNSRSTPTLPKELILALPSPSDVIQDKNYIFRLGDFHYEMTGRQIMHLYEIINKLNEQETYINNMSKEERKSTGGARKKSRRKSKKLKSKKRRSKKRRSKKEKI